jgi:hypothetical protein
MTPLALLAGMPSVTLTDVARLRLQTISFFLMGFLLSALAVYWLWNYLRRDFTRLPRLSYPKAVGLVGLWGLLFVLVLTMISGARELMTPGAWKKDGLTYTLAKDDSPAAAVVADEVSEDRRRRRLDDLRVALWAYARDHSGQFPPGQDDIGINPDRWQTPHPSGMRYLYVVGQAPSPAGRLLAYEPGVFGDDRLALFTDGEIRKLPLAEIRTLLGEGGGQ